jgi:hypothetical protein
MEIAQTDILFYFSNLPESYYAIATQKATEKKNNQFCMSGKKL